MRLIKVNLDNEITMSSNSFPASVDFVRLTLSRVVSVFLSSSSAVAGGSGFRLSGSKLRGFIALKPLPPCDMTIATETVEGTEPLHVELSQSRSGVGSGVVVVKVGDGVRLANAVTTM